MVFRPISIVGGDYFTSNEPAKIILVLGIIFLFICTAITPSIAVDNVNIEHTNGKSLGDDIDWWSMFRHDPQNSGYSTSDAPDTNNVLWEYYIGVYIYSSPAVVDGRVYIGSSDNNVYCLDAITGGYIWSSKSGYGVHSSPAIVDGRVYAASWNRYMFCLDAITGSHIWSYRTEDKLFSSPAVADDKVYFGSHSSNYVYEGKVYCLDAITGSYIWSFTPEEGVLSSPAVEDGKVYIGSTDNNVYCLDANTGDYIWSYKTDNDVDSSPAVVDGKVCIGSWDDKVYCLDANTGDYIWSYETVDPVDSSPAVAYNKVYIGSRGDKVYCLDADTGDYIWSYTTIDNAVSSPAVADGKVYIGSYSAHYPAYDGNLYCLDAITGSHIWTYRTGDQIHTPAVADGKVYIGLQENGIVFAFGELDSDAPSAPEIIGPKRGGPGILYNFTFKSESPLGNDLFYWIEWADGSNSGWLGPFDSGVEITESHKWDAKGIYPVQAKAKDTNGSVSSWGILRLTIPRNKFTAYSLFQWILERFPILERLLFFFNN